MTVWHDPKIAIAQTRAREIIRERGIRHPHEIVIDAIAWCQRVYVRERRLTGADGRTVRKPGRDFDAVISVRSDIREPGKKRFVIAHELGHFELHGDRDQFHLCRDRDLYAYRNIRPDEAEANAFAAELLMPASLFQPRCQNDPSMHTLQELAEEFSVTLISAAFRYIDCCPEQCGIVIAERGAVKWCKFTEGFRPEITRGQRLDEHTSISDYFEAGRLPRGVHQVPAQAWGIRADRVVLEESLVMPHYDSVITLIWDRHRDAYALAGYEDEDEDVSLLPSNRWRER